MLIEVLATPTCPHCHNAFERLKQALSNRSDIEVKIVYDVPRVFALGEKTVPLVLRDGKVWYKGDRKSSDEIKAGVDIFPVL